MIGADEADNDCRHRSTSLFQANGNATARHQLQQSPFEIDAFRDAVFVHNIGRGSITYPAGICYLAGRLRIVRRRFQQS